MKQTCMRHIIFTLLLYAVCCVSQAWAEPLRICTMSNDPPFTQRLPSGAWQGFVIDLWRALDIGQEYEFVDVDLPTALAGLEDGTCHALASNISVTPQRQQRFLFSTPFMHAGLGAMVRSDTTDIRSLADLDNKTIVTVKGSSSEQFVMDNIKHCTLIVLPLQSDVIKALVQKKADAIIFDSPTLHRIANNNGNTFVLLQEELYPQEYAFALQKNALPLQSAINTALTRLQESGAIRALVEKWFGVQ